MHSGTLASWLIHEGGFSRPHRGQYLSRFALVRIGNLRFPEPSREKPPVSACQTTVFRLCHTGIHPIYRFFQALVLFFRKRCLPYECIVLHIRRKPPDGILPQNTRHPVGRRSSYFIEKTVETISPMAQSSPIMQTNPSGEG